MKAVWWTIAVVGAGLLLPVAAEDGAPSAPQLWLLEKHSNIPMFLAGGGNTPEETTAQSQAMLKRPGLKRQICIAGDIRKTILEQSPLTKDCVIPLPKPENGAATVEGTCNGKTLRAVFAFGPDNRVRTVHTEIRDPADPGKGGTVDAVVESPDHITVTVTLNHVLNGVPMTDVLDFRRQPGGCGDLKPGENRAIPE